MAVTVGTSFDVSNAGIVSASSENKKVKKTGQASELDKDAFLKILMAQMENQDPLEPMNDTEFVSQMAQFTALEQVTNLTETVDDLVSKVEELSGNVTQSQAVSYLGKEVTTLDSSGEECITGTVSSVQLVDGVYQLTLSNVKNSAGVAIKDTNIAASDILRIGIGS